jgi:hypothetical protein
LWSLSSSVPDTPGGLPELGFRWQGFWRGNHWNSDLAWRLYIRISLPARSTARRVSLSAVPGHPRDAVVHAVHADGSTCLRDARRYSPNGDFECEWLARAGGWFMIVALGWIILSGLVLVGSELAAQAWAHSKTWLASLGGLGTLSGLVTALLGKSSSTPARGQATSLSGAIANFGLAIAGPLFAAVF